MDVEAFVHNRLAFVGTSLTIFPLKEEYILHDLDWNSEKINHALNQIPELNRVEDSFIQEHQLF
jgi:hypothetical protein